MLIQVPSDGAVCKRDNNQGEDIKEFSPSPKEEVGFRRLIYHRDFETGRQRIRCSKREEILEERVENLNSVLVIPSVPPSLPKLFKETTSWEHKEAVYASWQQSEYGKEITFTRNKLAKIVPYQCRKSQEYGEKLAILLEFL